MFTRNLFQSRFLFVYTAYLSQVFFCICSTKSLCHLSIYVSAHLLPPIPIYTAYNIYISKLGGLASRKSNDHQLEVVFQPKNSWEVKKIPLACGKASIELLRIKGNLSVAFRHSSAQGKLALLVASCISYLRSLNIQIPTVILEP